jgi:hypothetical protein
MSYTFLAKSLIFTNFDIFQKVNFKENIMSTAAIGDFRDGGVVFWVDPTDNTKGKVCALADVPTELNWSSARSYCYTYTNPNTGTGVYSDWYLPSKDELQLMYANLQRFGCNTNTPGGTDSGACPSRIGNFKYYYYWSSTETGVGYVWKQDFNNGTQVTSIKDLTCLVCAVRTF